jgi:phospholipid N-methyltransferase
VLVSLVDDLDALAGPTVLAVDDYHVVDAAGVHEAVSFLVDNLPPQVTVAMTTRADPSLPLSRLRARGELLEIRAALAPQGVFTTFAYVHARWAPSARRLQRLMQARFDEVVVGRTVWANLPPALVFYCHRPGIV